MLTYDLNEGEGTLYQKLYDCIKQDILNGKLATNEKMPSKRTLANNLGISTITIENAYDQLMSEGYMYSVPKKGYYICDISELKIISAPARKILNIDKGRTNEHYQFDFSANNTGSAEFPFSVWAKLMRDTISLKERELLTVSACEGVKELREAIAKHLSSFRGMNVDPDQIIVGAGTEYLYSLLIKLLGDEKVYCIENPGYKKLISIYESNGSCCKYVNMDEMGILVDELRSKNADVVHTSPTHHFPTGIMMPVSRRYELLAWANEAEGRYIIEDDYDSEFRQNGRPVPPLQSIDAFEKVIYMNTFSKTLTSTIRISYMVLPEHLVNLFYKKLSFYSNTVSTFEQYTLAAFISEGYLEKHINRMRLRYGKKRMRILEIINNTFDKGQYEVLENDSGLHFLLKLNTTLSDKEIQDRLMAKEIKISCISDYYIDGSERDEHLFIINYSNMNIEKLPEALKEVKNIM